MDSFYSEPCCGGFVIKWCRTLGPIRILRLNTKKIGAIFLIIVASQFDKSCYIRMRLYLILVKLSQYDKEFNEFVLTERIFILFTEKEFSKVEPTAGESRGRHSSHADIHRYQLQTRRVSTVVCRWVVLWNEILHSLTSESFLRLFSYFSFRMGWIHSLWDRNG